MTDLPILDSRPLQDLLDLGAGSDLIHELIALFQEDVPAHLEALHRALEAADAAQALQEAHQLKGSLANLGLMRFSDLARRIEDQARAGSLAGTPPLAEALPGAFEEALAALRAAFPVA